MRYFFDTEFIEEPGKIDLVSIGIVSETDERQFHVSADFNPSDAGKWVRENVFSTLEEMFVMPIAHIQHVYGLPRTKIAEEILEYIGDDPAPEFWAYFADYDWVVFCWLFGRMADLPPRFPMWCRDLKQLMDHFGYVSDDLPPQPDNHDALHDALWVKKAYDFIQENLLKGDQT
jgi:hypothetical protein